MIRLRFVQAGLAAALLVGPGVDSCQRIQATGTSEHPDCNDSHRSVLARCDSLSRVVKSEDNPTEGGTKNRYSLRSVFRNLPRDQKAIWTAPFHLRLGDAPWVVPLAGATGLLVARDQNIMLRQHSNLTAINRSDNIANGGTIALAGVPAMMYVWGSITGAGRARETGLLTGEALMNSAAVGEALKVVFGRERPTLTAGQGKFFQDFGDPSFPSIHSTLSWTAASVIAHEYPGWLSRFWHMAQRLR
jgi:hypothetical protein